MLGSAAPNSSSGSSGVPDRVRQCRRPPEPGLPLPLHLPQVTGQGLQLIFRPFILLPTNHRLE
jgi:hypothetical protein